MSIESSLGEQQLLADTVRRAQSDMNTRERLVEVFAAGGFVTAIAALWVSQPPYGLSIVPAAVCTVVLALAVLVRFETPFGFTIPTQLPFVPLLFAMPVALVPIATVLALGTARLPDVLRGDLRASRLLHVAGNAWFAIGPAAVFAIAGVEPRNAGPALLVAALTGQFLVDFLVCTLRVSVGRGASLSPQLRETWVYGIDAALAGVGLEVAKNVPGAPLAALTLVPLLGVFAMFAHERHGRLAGLLELNSAYRGTALVLGDVVEADDGYTGEHSRGVVALAIAVAERLDLGPERLRNVEFAALLHDVGKIAIPKEIINKPGKLDPQEWTVIKTHTLEGQRMLDRVGGFMREVGLIVRSHHERWDGRGYPDGLAGEAIPLEARIIACCDTWNAMRTDRAYRKALSQEAALAELLASAGSQLDPRIVKSLTQIVDPLGKPELARTQPIEPPAAPKLDRPPISDPVAA